MRGAKSSQEAENWAEEVEESLARCCRIAGLSTPIQLESWTDFCSYPFPSTALPVDSTSHPKGSTLTTVLGKNKTQPPVTERSFTENRQAQFVSTAYLQLDFKQQQSQVSFPTALKPIFKCLYRFSQQPDHHQQFSDPRKVSRLWAGWTETRPSWRSFLHF